MQSISVTVTSVIFPREPFSDGRERFVSFNSSMGKCAGMLAFYPKPGMKLKLSGEYSVFRCEQQFKFKKVMHDTPEDKRALLEYAASLTKGVGPAAVEKIWNAYGEEWDAHLDDLSPSQSVSLTRTLNELHSNEDRLRVINFMLHIGGTPKMAEAAFLRWKQNAIATIQQDPYVLSTLPGIGFKTVDGRLREHFGISDTDMRRAVAAVEYALLDALEESGCSVLDRDALYRAVNDLRVPRKAVASALVKLVASGRIVFVGLDKVTSAAVVKHESDIARYVAENNKITTSPVPSSISPVPSSDSSQSPVPPSLSSISPVPSSVVFDGAATPISAPEIAWPDGFNPDDDQQSAAFAAVACTGLTVINGGAGCGKTTIIQAIAKTLMKDGNAVSLCALAGKAAARLREASGLPASTIHSMLGWSGEGFGFTSGNLHGKTIILDEASMVPSALLYEITKRDPERLILVGDQAQLQPVGIGSPFHDIIDELPSVVHTLRTCYRNKEAVFSAAARIRNGDVPHDAKSKEEVFSIRNFNSPSEIHEYVCDLALNGEIDFDQDLVLSPRNGEGDDPAPATVAALNSELQRIENKHAPGEKFKVGDRVMFTKNWAEKSLWNGTVGWISRVDTDGTPFFAPDDGDEVKVSEKEKRGFIVPAYCLTVHKAQGSQYRDVYVVCTRRDEARLFDRSMLYTAVTRAKHGCHLLCDDGLDRIVNAVRRRRTYLQLLLKGEV